ncbi:unnamed protein product [Acanthoscelides obtectus]|uniref:Uncharacterized protein n=1 Tax=Acanthoscelides obtectus TaxID=200917 RepID=A0A9P0LUB8_ACAOB|nr:unnamed protein product [Acanthoscelides obtectus]CAK1633658.1 hypothetical protein AOBTE_LOCUS8295 [Acanthoscelides obtectus]
MIASQYRATTDLRYLKRDFWDPLAGSPSTTERGPPSASLQSRATSSPTIASVAALDPCFDLRTRIVIPFPQPAPFSGSSVFCGSARAVSASVAYWSTMCARHAAVAL